MIAWIGIVISVLALVASGASTIYTRRSADAAKVSADAARVSAAAAEVSADAATRSTAVAERDEQRRQEEADRAAVAWRIVVDPLMQDAETYAFRLVNDGTRPALDVVLTPPSGTQERGNVPRGETIKDGGSVSFQLFPPAHNLGAAEMTVRWLVESKGREYVQRWPWADLEQL